MKDHNLTRLISSATRLNNSSQFWKTLNRYLLIGFSTLLLIYIGGVGRVDITNNTVLADFDPRCGQDGSKCHDSAGCVGNISVWGTWDEDGNLIKEIERVGEVPGQCGNPPASSGAACEQNSGLCGENTTFCENTGMGSLKMFKHGGVCNPSHGEADANGCIFVFDPVESFSGPDCTNLVSVAPAPQQPAPVQPAPALTCGGPNPDRATPEPNCNKAGAPQGLCCTICGNGNCDRFNGENESNCSQDCAAPATVSQPEVSQEQQAEAPAAQSESANACTDSTCQSQSQSQNNNQQQQVTLNPSNSGVGTSAPAGGGVSSSSNNSGGNSTNTVSPNITVSPTITSTATVSNPSPQVVLASAPVAVAQLPKTGVTPLAWAFTSFIPLGFSLKRMGKTPKGSLKMLETPDNLCQERIVRKFN